VRCKPKILDVYDLVVCEVSKTKLILKGVECEISIIPILILKDMIKVNFNF